MVRLWLVGVHAKLYSFILFFNCNKFNKIFNNKIPSSLDIVLRNIFYPIEAEYFGLIL